MGISHSKLSVFTFLILKHVNRFIAWWREGREISVCWAPAHVCMLTDCNPSNSTSRYHHPHLIDGMTRGEVTHTPEPVI